MNFQQMRDEPLPASAAAFLWRYIRIRPAHFIAMVALVMGAACCAVVVQYGMKLLVDAMAELTYGKWSLSVNGANIFDKRVYTNCSYSGGTINEGYCYLGKDRTVLASLRRRF